MVAFQYLENIIIHQKFHSISMASGKNLSRMNHLCKKNEPKFMKYWRATVTNHPSFCDPQAPV